MKRLFLYIAIFLYFITIPVQAYDPIIINQSLGEHPGSPDQDYVPLDTKKVAIPNFPDSYLPVETVPRTIQISETFQPIKVCPSPSTSTTYNPLIGYTTTTTTPACYFLPQTKNQLHQDVGDFSHWTNYGPRLLNVQFGLTYKNPLDNEDSLDKAFYSFDAETTIGTSNAARRSLDDKTLKCLIGKRIWLALETLPMPDGSTPKDPLRDSVDVVIYHIPVINYGVRISEVAFALQGAPIFYNPASGPCTPQSKPQGLPGNLLAALNFAHLSTLKVAAGVVGDITGLSQKLYANAIEPVNDNSLAGTVRQCDMKEGQVDWTACKPWQNRSFPQSGGYPGDGAEVMTWLMPHNTTITQTSYNNPSSAANTPDKTNGFTFKAIYTHDWFLHNEIITEPKTFSGPTFLQYQIPNNLESGIRTSETAMRWYLPQSVITAEGLDDVKGSSTDGLTIDPGLRDEKIRHQVQCELWPKDWQDPSYCVQNNVDSLTPTPSTQHGKYTDICQAALAYKVPCEYLKAIWMIESSDAKSCDDAGSAGPMQIVDGDLPYIDPQHTLDRCNLSDSWELGARTLLWKMYGSIDPNNPTNNAGIPYSLDKNSRALRTTGQYNGSNACAPNDETECRWGQGVSYCDAVISLSQNGTMPGKCYQPSCNKLNPAPTCP